MKTNTKTNNASSATIWTEGKTDWKILKKAAEPFDLDFILDFHEVEKDMGSDQLIKRIQAYSERDNQTPQIFIFDNDDKNVVERVMSSGGTYKDWGNNVYSFVLPTPSHRKEYTHISIEMYFKDNEIQRQDTKGRQLFLSSSFNELSGNHTQIPSVHYTLTGHIKGCTSQETAKVIDSDVYDANNNNIALSKSDFAEYVSQGIEPFHDLDFLEFASVFEIIELIVKTAYSKHSAYLPNIDQFISQLESMESVEQYASILKMVDNTISLALEIFIITTIRVYENQIINEPADFHRRATPIKKILTEAFRKPSLRTLQQLSEKCIYLIDDKTSPALIGMKETLLSTFMLGEVGQFWEDLETLFSSDSSKPKIFNKPSIHRELLRKVIPEIAEYSSKPNDVIKQALNGVIDHTEIKISNWIQSLKTLVSILQPLLSKPLVLRSIVNRDQKTDEYIIEVKAYENGIISLVEQKVDRLSDEYQKRSSELILDGNNAIRLYPMLLIREDSLYMYQRTTPLGYEYLSISTGRIFCEETKRKFSQSLFQTGSKQELFWTDVIPTENPSNGIRANIPDEGPYEFIGRKKQIKQIKDEIITVVNENGILYGPGGIGKTALMIQLTKELYEEKDKNNIPYNNIVWVSAKQTFYDYVSDTIEQREPQVKSLDNIIMAILKFFDFEDVEDYSFEDRKELVLELFAEKKILLIVDNFETIQRGEAEKIIDFFGTQSKQYLKKCPENFKIIMTSREYLPLGFKPIQLSGLDMRESKHLMDSLYKRYKATKSELTDEQKENLHENTKGIPILIKHCYAKIYEYNEPINTVVRNLTQFSGNIVQFSFKEILDRVENESNRTSLQILILLDIVDIPLMLRQVSDILEVEEITVEGKIPILYSFECVKSINQGNQQKYILNDEIRLLTKSLAQKHRDLTQSIRQKYFRNFTFDKQMDYTSEEEEIIEIFEGYIKNRQFSEAEDFIKKELKKHQDSILLNFYYAKYLKDRRNEIDNAITILEDLRTRSHNHPAILKLLLMCYSNASIPKFEHADNLIDQIQADLGEYLKDDLELQMGIARLYIRWSTTLKLAKGIDPFEENRRVFQYKELANKALGFLQPLEAKLLQPGPSTHWDIRLHEVYYRMSQCFYNLWEYDNALKMITKAISLGKGGGVVEEYEKFRNYILNNKEFYGRYPWIDKRKSN
jgi:hypothetical protein